MVTASAQPASDRPLTVPPRWGFLTNHAVILVYVILHPESTVRAISAGVGVTERACLAILRDLDDDGIIIRHRDGRRNTYAVDFDRLSGVRRGGTATPLTPRPFVEGVIRMLYDIARERGLVSHHHEPRRRQDHQLEARAGTWGFFTNHLLVLLAVARDHRSTVRDIAVAVGITERAAASGSSAAQTALITAAPSAPAAATDAMFSALIPPIAMTGTVTAAFTTAMRSVSAGRVTALVPVGKIAPTAT